MLLKYRLPLAEVVTDFYDELKGRSSGFASFDYEEDGYDDADLVKVICIRFIGIFESIGCRISFSLTIDFF